ncbi:hypothetical protein [Rhodococcus sp. IEGM 1366]|uniref:hypothetical protein n=1 Tax=Rhodococcus sp. IEGM 1366 TaxID=3082223 RepID=UPI002955DE85|nr:hypothetical protein [Rhodococcus sp. IEGM 1366]
MRSSGAEIEVRGPHVAIGDLGDLTTEDAAGHVRISGRTIDMIIVDGSNASLP